MTIVEPAAEPISWYTMSAEAAAERLGVEPGTRAGRRRGDPATGRVRAATSCRPSHRRAAGQVARGQLTNPMNIMLLIVGVASFAIGQVATGVVVLALVTFNVVMGSNQELKARASVEALAQLQVPARGCGDPARSRRSNRRTSCPGTSCCSRRATSCPRTGGSSPPRRSRCRRRRSPARARRWPRTPPPCPSGEIALGDRTNLVFQNTQVTRGSATFVVDRDRPGDRRWARSPTW